jgi:hypothetical protein
LREERREREREREIKMNMIQNIKYHIKQEVLLKLFFTHQTFSKLTYYSVFPAPAYKNHIITNNIEVKIN